MVKIGLFTIGLAAYWPQFPGLRERLAGYGRFVGDQIRSFGAQVIDVGMVDDQPKSVAAGKRFAQEDVDLVVCFVSTYATSSQVVPVVGRLGKPVLVLNLQPTAKLDYSRTGTGEWLANCQACCVPEIACAFERCGIQFHTVTGLLGLPEQTADALANEVTAEHPAAIRAWNEIEDWVRATSAVKAVREARFGFLGHTYPGMLDMYSDFTQITGAFGCHVEVLEMEDLENRAQNATNNNVSAKLDEARRVFEFAEANPNDPISLPPSPEALQAACRASVGLDKLVGDLDLSGLAYYHQSELAGHMILGCSLLTARGVPCSGEGDLKNAIAMKLMDSLGAGGSFTELYAMDFEDRIILMGHDGPFHLTIAEGRPALRGLGLFHGKVGSGVSVEATVKHGPVTILGLTQTRDGRMKMLVAEGECVPGETLRIGNTNSRIRFGGDIADWMNAWAAQGPTHHVALGIGHQAARIRYIGKILGVEVVEL